MQTAQIAASPITDHTAELVLKIAEKFFAQPENQKAYRKWHLKQFGRLPEELQTIKFK